MTKVKYQVHDGLDGANIEASDWQEAHAKAIAWVKEGWPQNGEHQLIRYSLALGGRVDHGWVNVGVTFVVE